METGLLLEMWDKGMLWDKAIGYFWAPLQNLQRTRVVRKIKLYQNMHDVHIKKTKSGTFHPSIQSNIDIILEYLVF